MTPERIREALREHEQMVEELREQRVAESAKTNHPHITISYNSGSESQSKAAHADIDGLLTDGYIIIAVRREYHGVAGHYTATLTLEHR